jgi:glycolate oxidase FAD binding subunit
LVTRADAAMVRDAAERAGGHATLFRAQDKRAGAFHPLSPAAARIQRDLMDAFDPDAVFDRGRLWPDA